MNRKTLSFIALAFSMIYGVSVGVFHLPDSGVALGGVLVALLWISVGVFGRGESAHDRRHHDRV